MPIVLLLFLLCCDAVTLTVQTQYGAVQGRVLGNNVARAWLGVPFAASTAGANRFTAPKAPQSWTDVRDATVYGPGCPQQCNLPSGLCPETQSEDCLHVDVYAPMATSATPRPVLVFIYGGAFVQGTNGCSAYDARNLANGANAIVVNLSYRLGVLGFLINANSDGNYGILDQRFALQWVQKNIASFGGDPDQVTLYGQSAGAMSVAYHLVDPASWGLFRRVMIQSNPLGMPMLTHSTGVIFTAVAAEAIGCDLNDVECFRNCVGDCLDKLLSAQTQGAGEQILHPFASFLT
jgi:carboxylesterase type B